jgi:hypothetical protein
VREAHKKRPTSTAVSPVILCLSKDQFSSFPNFIWERLLFLAKLHFALNSLPLCFASQSPVQLLSSKAMGQLYYGDNLDILRQL